MICHSCVLWLKPQCMRMTTVILAHGKDRHETASKLSSAMAKMSDGLFESFLTLNISKTSCMFFYISKNKSQPDMFAKGEWTSSHFKYSVIFLESQLYFRKHVKHVKRVQYCKI